MIATCRVWIKNWGWLTVLDRHGLEQVVQTRLRTGSVDSEKLECEVSSACSWASSTDFNRAPQSPHWSETPAISGDFFGRWIANGKIKQINGFFMSQFYMDLDRMRSQLSLVVHLAYIWSFDQVRSSSIKSDQNS